jgi:hypothetical protein
MARRSINLRTGIAGFGGVPPVSKSQSAATPPDGLTPRFNAASEGQQANQSKPLSVSAAQIVALEKKLSRQAHTNEMTPRGNVIGSYDPNRDRKISHQIKAMQKALSKQQNLARKAFAKAQLQDKAKQAFNRSSGIQR